MRFLSAPPSTCRKEISSVFPAAADCARSARTAAASRLVTARAAGISSADRMPRTSSVSASPPLSSSAVTAGERAKLNMPEAAFSMPAISMAFCSPTK